MARQYECCVTVVNEWVWSKVRSNGTVFFTSREQGRISKSGKLKRLKSSYSLSSCLFEALKVRHLRDQPLTDRQTDKQSDYYNPLVHVY